MDPQSSLHDASSSNRNVNRPVRVQPPTTNPSQSVQKPSQLTMWFTHLEFYLDVQQKHLEHCKKELATLKALVYSVLNAIDTFIRCELMYIFALIKDGLCICIS
jgi:hypothetical protein